jgi:hypothetical protein
VVNLSLVQDQQERSKANSVALECGPVTALRVLGHGFELDLGQDEVLRIGRLAPPENDIKLPMVTVSRRHAIITRSGSDLVVTDLGSKNGISQRHHRCTSRVRCDSIRVRAGDRFSLGSVDLLALDDVTQSIIKLLERFFGPRGVDEVDHALDAILCGHVMVVHGESEGLLCLARMLHAHSSRRGHSFTHITRAPESDEAIAQLCASAACGVVYLDVTRPFAISPRLASELLSRERSIWTIVGTTAGIPDDILLTFGRASEQAQCDSLAICPLGFPPREQTPARAPSFARAVLEAMKNQ